MRKGGLMLKFKIGDHIKTQIYRRYEYDKTTMPVEHRSVPWSDSDLFIERGEVIDLEGCVCGIKTTKIKQYDQSEYDYTNEYLIEFDYITDSDSDDILKFSYSYWIQEEYLTKIFNKNRKEF